VYSIFLLLSPENQPQQHLQAMNIVFSNLQKDMFRRYLRQAETREGIVDLLDEADLGSR
jgi:mannitol/fructose-specific phosphotransferase system IIA component (Ntr-type)